MPAQNPKKISVTAPPAAPKPKQADPTIPSTKARMTDPREAENRRNLEAVQRGVDYLNEPAGRQRNVTTATTTPRGGASGAGGGSGGGGGGGTVKQTLWQGLLGGGAQPKAQAAMQMAPTASPASQPYRESDGPRRFSAAPVATQPSVQQYMANQLLNRVSTTGYSPGVLATRERQKAQQELAGLGLPPAAHSAALARIQQGDTQVVNRAAQLVSQVPPEALGRGKVAQYIAQELLGGDGAQQFDAGRQADLGHYRQVAQKNTERAQANSGQAIKFGLDPLASEQQLVAEQRRRNQMAYPSADLASLQKLAAAGDVDAGRAIEGTPGPWAPGRPEMGVRANTQAREDAVLQQRYVMPAQTRADSAQAIARMRQETAAAREAGLDKRALMKVNPLTGQPESISADQVLRTYQTAMKSYEHANGTLDDFPRFFDWASSQGFKLAPQMGQGVAPAVPAAPGMQAGPSPGAAAGATMGASPARDPDTQRAVSDFATMDADQRQQVVANLRRAMGDPAKAAQAQALLAALGEQ